MAGQIGPVKKSVVLLGKGELGIRVGAWFLDSDVYELRCVVPSMPEPRWTVSLAEWARFQDIPVVEGGRTEGIAGVLGDDWRTDLAFSVYYNRIVKPWFIDKCGLVLNLHNAPLPRYRGVAPVNWALKNGETDHGVTIHVITPGIDDGPIVAQVRFSIYPDIDEVVDVYRRCLEFGWLLFEKTMPRVDDIIPRPQDESLAQYYTRKDARQLGGRRGWTRGESNVRES